MNTHSSSNLRNRSTSGASIILVTALICLVIALAVGSFYVSKGIGGSHQLGNAVEAGALNTAKQLLSVSVPLDRAEYIQFREFTDHPQGPAETLPPGGATINLLNYNRVVAQAALVQANAEAEEGGNFAGTTPAYTNADIIAQEANNIGARLRQKIVEEFGKEAFLGTINKNDVSLLTPARRTSAQSIRRSGYRVSYMEANTWRRHHLPDSGASNITMEGLGGRDGHQEFINAGRNVLNSRYLPQVVRYRGYPTAPIPGRDEQVHFLQGFSPIPTVRGGRTLIATPLQPFELPHLVSSKDFAANETPAFDTTSVCPNAIQSSASGSTGSNTSSIEQTASAICSVLDSANHPELIFPISISRGFVVLTNFPGPDIAGVTRRLSGTPMNIAGTQARDIFDQELSSTAIYYHEFPQGTVFTTDPTLWTYWLHYNVGPVTPGAAEPPNPPNTSPALANTHIFGDPHLINIPFEQARKFDSVNPPPPHILAALEAAYGRDFGHAQSGSGSQTPPVLEPDFVPATVYAKAQVVAARNHPASWRFDGTNYNTDVVIPQLYTGIELYPEPGLTGTFPAYTPAQLHFTKHGAQSATPYQLMLQATGYKQEKVDLMIKYIAQRCTEMTTIYGDADGRQIVERVKQLLNAKGLPLGESLFIYHPINANVPPGTLVIGGPLGATAPRGALAIGPAPDFIVSNQSPDGTGGPEDTASPAYAKNHPGVRFQVDFPLLGHVLNAHGDQGLNQRMFGDNPDVGPQGHNAIRWIASSGRTGMLGVVFFSEWTDSGTYRFGQPR